MNKLPRRVWINCPSKHQPYHDLHGKKGLSIDEAPGISRFYFIEGEIISQLIDTKFLISGWKETRGAY